VYAKLEETPKNICTVEKLKYYVSRKKRELEIKKQTMKKRSVAVPKSKSGPISFV
jgi:hypothetical protein